MSGIEPTVWSIHHFKSETNPKLARKKLANVDHGLEVWGDVQRIGTVDAKLTALFQLKNYCDLYVTNQKAKKGRKEEKTLGKPSKTLINRINKTETLAKQVWERIAWETYHKRKANQPNQVGQSTHKAMLPGYSNERANFLKQKQQRGLAGTNKVINPTSGSHVHDIHHGGGWQAHNQNLPQGITDILAKNYDQLTEPEFTRLMKYFKVTPTADYYGGNEQQVHYSRKDERIKERMLVCDPIGRLLLNGSPANMDMAIWAMDTYGNLLGANPQVHHQSDAGTGQWNHSSLNAGKDVICAGTMRIVGGQLTMISNESGHYQPNATKLSNAIATLVEEGCDLSMLTEIRVMGGQNYDSVANFSLAHPHE